MTTKQRKERAGQAPPSGTAVGAVGAKREPKNTPQWQAVRDARKEIEQGDYVVLESLESTWQLIDSDYGFIKCKDGSEVKVMDRDTLERTSDSPLSALMHFIDMGFYPPPELLLGLLASWEQYLDEGKSLEEVFLGKPKRKAGSYAARRLAKSRDMALASTFVKYLDQGLTQAEAAERIVDERGYRVDPETLARRLRRTVPFKISRYYVETHRATKP